MIYLQCGYEDDCKKKECLKCPRKKWKKLNLTLAEQIVIEDFAMSDLKDMLLIDEKKVEFMQGIMRKLMFRVFSERSDLK